MKICIFSDTHGQHDLIKIPKADVAIFCGDFTSRNSLYELDSFATWLGKLKMPVIFCAGNHDALEHNVKLVKDTLNTLAPNVTYLCHEATEMFGYKCFISPVQPVFCGWHFNVPDDKRGAYWDQIPEDTEILVTHCPPYGILDKVVTKNYFNNLVEYVGDKLLAERIKKLPKLKLHAFGHLHDGGWKGTGNKKPKKIIKKGTIFVNGSVLNDQYSVEKVYAPIVIEI